jgi:predicted phosphodiesterase
MRYGLISDIHGNLAALRAAVSFLSDAGVDGYLCPGDVVGYGPQPNECVEILASLPAHCVAGNHDLIATGRLTDEHIGALARRTLEWTRSVLEPGARAWLEALPQRAEVPGAVVAHGSLTDPRRYISTDKLAAQQLALLAQEETARILVLGHTHRATAFGERSGRVLDSEPRTIALSDAERWLLNPGAIGQSRRRGVHAWVAVLDLDRRSAAFHALPYDVDATRTELLRHGLPPSAVHLPPRRWPRALVVRLVAAARSAGRSSRP